MNRRDHSTSSPGDVRVSLQPDDVSVQPGTSPEPHSPPPAAQQLNNPYSSLTRKPRPTSQGNGSRAHSAYSPQTSFINTSLDRHNESLTSLRSIYDKTTAKDGCLILGTKASQPYITRFRINTQVQRANLGTELLREECCPVCVEEEEGEEEDTCCNKVFKFISGESFLLSLHITALLVGVAKEAFEVGEIGEDLEILHSTLETLVAVIQLTIRIFATRSQRRSINKVVRSAQHVTGEHSVTGHNLQRLVNMFCVLAVVLILFTTICLIAFALSDHLTWTILSNNFVMIVGTVTSNLILLRISRIQSAIRMDQHKTVLYESTLLLQESVKVRSEQQQTAYRKRLKLFLTALADTELFRQPDHIELDQKHKDKYDLMTNLEMMSYV